MTDNQAPLSILTFKTGTLHVNFPDCNKQPGIYGTLFNPIELLDQLIIKDGVNAEDVRFAGQFSLSQKEICKKMEEGILVWITEKLELYL